MAEPIEVTFTVTPEEWRDALLAEGAGIAGRHDPRLIRIGVWPLMVAISVGAWFIGGDTLPGVADRPTLFATYVFVAVAAVLLCDRFLAHVVARRAGRGRAVPLSEPRTMRFGPDGVTHSVEGVTSVTPWNLVETIEWSRRIIRIGAMRGRMFMVPLRVAGQPDAFVARLEALRAEAAARPAAAASANPWR